MKTKISDVISVTLLITGTIVGAGMLGMPLVTSSAGFFPAVGITVFVWLFMWLTGLLFLEATLWMPKNSNVLSMTKKYLGSRGRLLAGGLFVFLYFSLMIAYIAAGAPLLISLIGIQLPNAASFAFFTLIFGSVVAIGIRFIDRLNYFLTAALFVTYFFMMAKGGSEVAYDRLLLTKWKEMFYAAPILFCAFGYHNIIPSLTYHFKKNARVMRLGIFFGTLIPLIIYIAWQGLIIGAVPKSYITEALQKGQPITEALSYLTGTSWVKKLGRIFGLFALTTSLLGVAFSVVDFIGDGLKMKRTGLSRVVLCFLTFFPSFVLACLDPSVFVFAIGIAGGFGEAFLNGILPVWLVWVGRYKKKMESDYLLPGGKWTLTGLLVLSFAVIGLEVMNLMR